MERAGNCPVCASPDQKRLSYAARESTLNARLVRCTSCSFVYRTAGDLSILAHWDGDDALPITTARTAPDQHLFARLDIVENAVNRGSLLDLGCGSGRFIELAQRKGWMVAGIEASRAAEEAQHRTGARILPTLREGLWPAGRFDAITSWDDDTMSRRTAEFLHLAAHYCRIDGVLAMQLRQNDRRRQRELPEGRDCDFSLTSLRRMMSKFGFRIERIMNSAAVAEAGRIHSQPASRDMVLIARYIP